MRWWRERKRQQRERLLTALAEGKASGFQLMRRARLSSYALHTMLDDLVDVGVVKTRLESPPPDRPPRTLYRLTS